MLVPAVVLNNGWSTCYCGVKSFTLQKQNYTWECIYPICMCHISTPNLVSCFFITGKLKSVPTSGQRQILKQHHEAIHLYMNIDIIKPYLYQSGLLTHTEMDELSNETLSKANCTEKVLGWLPEKGPDALAKLIVCLRKSAAGTGTAHKELARKLKHGLQDWKPQPNRKW